MLGIFEHSRQLDIQLGQGLAAFRHVVLEPVNCLGDGGDYGLEQVASRDALSGVDDSIAYIGDVGGEVVEEGTGDGGLSRGFDAVNGEVAAGRCVGLQRSSSLAIAVVNLFNDGLGLDEHAAGLLGTGFGARDREMSAGRVRE